MLPMTPVMPLVSPATKTNASLGKHTMVVRVLWAAIIAGFISGLVVSAVQAVKVTPLILEAETYESGAEGHNHSDDGATDASGAEHSHGEGAWAPQEGLERYVFTTLANVLTSVGFALLLVAGYTLSRREVDWQKGLLWGAAGFAACALIPAVTLPPEVPGAAGAAVEIRQLYWAGIAIVSALGIACFALAKSPMVRIPGALLVLGPIFLFPPHAEGHGTVPPELAAHFVTASLGTAAIFWLVLGALSALFYKRFTG